MKKIFTVAILFIAVIASAFTFAACTDKDETATVVSYKIDSTTYTVEDTYSSADVVVTATMSDETTDTVENNLLFVGDDATSLKLDEDGAFTTTGTYNVKVYFIVADDREDERYYLGVWEIVVNAKK